MKSRINTFLTYLPKIAVLSLCIGAAFANEDTQSNGSSNVRKLCTFEVNSNLISFEMPTAQNNEITIVDNGQDNTIPFTHNVSEDGTTLKDFKFTKDNSTYTFTPYPLLGAKNGQTRWHVSISVINSNEIPQIVTAECKNSLKTGTGIRL